MAIDWDKVKEKTKKGLSNSFTYSKNKVSEGNTKFKNNFQSNYMKNDINLNLLILIVILVVFLVGLSLYYHLSYGSLLDDYDDLHDLHLETKTNLTITANELKIAQDAANNVTGELQKTIQIQEQSREEFNDIYEQTEEELTKTESTLASTKAELVKVKSDLEDKTLEAKELKEDLDIANAKVKDFERIQDNLNDLENDVEDCQDLSDDAEAGACVKDINT